MCVIFRGINIFQKNFIHTWQIKIYEYYFFYVFYFVISYQYIIGKKKCSILLLTIWDIYIFRFYRNKMISNFRSSFECSLNFQWDKKKIKKTNISTKRKDNDSISIKINCMKIHSGQWCVNQSRNRIQNVTSNLFFILFFRSILNGELLQCSMYLCIFLFFLKLPVHLPFFALFHI